MLVSHPSFGTLGMVQAEVEANDATSSLGTLRILGVHTAPPQHGSGPAQGFPCVTLPGIAKGDPKAGKEKGWGMLELQPGCIKGSQSSWAILAVLDMAVPKGSHLQPSGNLHLEQRSRGILEALG